MRYYFALSLGILLLSWTSFGQAGGFHYQVSTSAYFYADSAGRLAGVRMNWVYDPDVSAAITGGRPVNTEAGLQQLASDMIMDLHQLSYYINLSLNNAAAPIGKAVDFSAQITPEQSILLGMQIPMQQALDIRGKTIAMSLIDPDGSAALSYTGADRIVLGPGLTENCSQPALTAQERNINEHLINVQTVRFSCR